MLRDVRACLAVFATHYGAGYRLANAQMALRLAAVVAPPGACPLATAGRLLCELPLGMIIPGGEGLVASGGLPCRCANATVRSQQGPALPEVRVTGFGFSRVYVASKYYKQGHI